MIHGFCPQKAYNVEREINMYYIYSISYNLLKRVICTITEEEKTKNTVREH